MEKQAFHSFVSSLDTLDTVQYRVLKACISKHDKKQENGLILSQNKRTICPHCKSNKFIRWAKRQDLQRYKCKECKKTFNELTDTPLARLRKKGRWVTFCECMLKGYSVRKAAAECSIHYNTAFKWRHRFLQNPKSISPKSLAGVVELTDFQLPYSQKGTKKAAQEKLENNRSNPQAQATKPTQIKAQAKLVTVFFARDRNGNTTDSVMEALSPDRLARQLIPLIKKDILLCSDSKQAYLEVSKAQGYQHGKLRIDEGLAEYRNVIHLHNLTNYVADFQKWMERFRGVATKYLDAYLGWYRNMEEFNFDLAPEALLLRAKTHAPYLHQPSIMTE